MIKEKNIIKIKIKCKLEKIINSIIIHLGKNPKNGGNPPRESKTKNNVNFNNWLILKKEKIWLILNILKLLNKITIEIFNKE